MNTPNPLIPQGLLTKESKGKANIRIAVFTILALHVVLLGGLLMQGCKPEVKKDAQDTLSPTNAFSQLPESPYHSNTNPPPDSIVGSVTQAPPVVQMESVPPTPAPTPTPAFNTIEYTVARGDNYHKIGNAKGVSVRMLEKANPGVDPLKLKVGQKLQIPSPTTPPATQAVASEEGAHDMKHSSYVVKAGDNLVRIAKQHGTTVGAIKAANNLKTTQIKVGQKLKLPAGKSSVGKPSPGTTPSVASSNLKPLTGTSSIPQQ
jgi:LysM repeat protein